jgi:hypothetical protein
VLDSGNQRAYLVAAMEVIISTPSSTRRWTPYHDVLRMHLASFLTRRGINIGEDDVQFVEGDSDQAGLVLESSPDLCRLAVSACLKEWNALLSGDSKFVEELSDWSERDKGRAQNEDQIFNDAQQAKD